MAEKSDDNRNCQKALPGTVSQHIFELEGSSDFITPLEEWAVPGGIAIPGHPLAKAEQAPNTSPKSKNQFNIEVLQWRTYQILS